MKLFYHDPIMAKPGTLILYNFPRLALSGLMGIFDPFRKTFIFGSMFCISMLEIPSNQSAEIARGVETMEIEKNAWDGHRKF